jgi:predicted methyltransferase
MNDNPVGFPPVQRSSIHHGPVFIPMKQHLLSGVALTGALAFNHATGLSIAPSAAAAVASPLRPNADVQVDADRKPAELLTFAGIRSGDKVADLIPGDGYFTRLFRQLVGPQGHVFAVVPQGLAAASSKRLDPIKELIAAPGYDNVSLIVRPYEEIGVDTPLDVVWTSQNYHDIYGEVGPFAVPGISGKEEAAKLDAAAFKALKPGGLYIVIDHAAKSGSTGGDAKTLHRMDAATVIAQVTAAGFVLEDRSDVLANPQDGHDKVIFAPEIRRHTDKFVLKFRKPRS